MADIGGRCNFSPPCTDCTVVKRDESDTASAALVVKTHELPRFVVFVLVTSAKVALPGVNIEVFLRGSSPL